MSEFSENAEMQRMADSWSETKKQLQSRDFQIESLTAQLAKFQLAESKRNREARDCEVIKTLNIELKDKVRFMEIQLVGKKEECVHWCGKYENLKEELEESKKKILEESETNKALSIAVSKAKQEGVDMLNRSLEQIRDRDTELKDKDRIISTLREECRDLEMRVANLKKEVNVSMEKVHKARSKLDSKKSLLNSTRKMLASHKVEYSIMKESDSSSKNTLKQLKIDNTRLVHLISKTKEYKDFRDYYIASESLSYVPFTKHKNKRERERVEASKNRNFAKNISNEQGKYLGLTKSEWRELRKFRKQYLSHVPRNATKEELKQMSITVDPESSESIQLQATIQTTKPQNETSHWIPSKVLQISSEFRQKHLSHVPQRLIIEYLQQLHLIWHRSRKRSISTIRDRFQKICNSAERIRCQTKPYAVVLLEEKVRQLQRQLKQSMQYNDSRATGPVSRSLRMVEILSQQVEQLQQKIKWINIQHRKKRRIKNTSNADACRRRFVEGGLWFGRNAAYFANGLSERVIELLEHYDKEYNAIDLKEHNDTKHLTQLHHAILEQFRQEVGAMKHRLQRAFNEGIDAYELMNTQFEDKLSKYNNFIHSLPLDPPFASSIDTINYDDDISIVSDHSIEFSDQSSDESLDQDIESNKIKTYDKSAMDGMFQDMKNFFEENLESKTETNINIFRTNSRNSSNAEDVSFQQDNENASTNEQKSNVQIDSKMISRHNRDTKDTKSKSIFLEESIKSETSGTMKNNHAEAILDTFCDSESKRHSLKRRDSEDKDYLKSSTRINALENDPDV